MIGKKRWVALLASALIAIAIPAISQQQSPATPIVIPVSQRSPVAPRSAVPANSSARNEPGTPTLTASDVAAWMDGYFPAILKQGKIAGAQCHRRIGTGRIGLGRLVRRLY